MSDLFSKQTIQDSIKALFETTNHFLCAFDRFQLILASLPFSFFEDMNNKKASHLNTWRIKSLEFETCPENVGLQPFLTEKH